MDQGPLKAVASSRPSLTYRPEIDGIRAIAVVAVLFYHIGFARFSGGFAGVDVFYVISGFLITGIIFTRTQENLAVFAANRARRLFPALAVTIVVSLIAAGFLFTPHDYARAGASGLFAASSLSNWLFWTEDSYWGGSKYVKPLLHTWSLGVEVQFYIVWSVALTFLRSRRKLAYAFIAGSALISLVAAVIALPMHPRAVFFLTPFRLFEFAIGAGLWFVASPRSRWMSEALSAIGLALIVYSIVAFDENMAFPGAAALIPCIGTGLIVYSGRSPLIGRALSFRPIYAIGLFSYSLYLVHWPLIVFTRSYLGRPFDLAEQWALIVLSVGLAWVLYRLVEVPYRKPASPKYPNKLSPAAFGAFAAVTALAIVIPSSTIWASGGWSWRVGEVKEFTNGLQGCDYPFCKSASGSGPELVVTGDSHARMYYQGLHKVIGGKTPFSIFHFDAACRFVNVDEDNRDYGYDCQDRLNKYLAYVKEHKPVDMIIVHRWVNVGRHMPLKKRTEFIAQRLRDLLDRPELASVKRVLLVLNVPEFRGGQHPADCYNRPKFLFAGDCATAPVEEFHHTASLNKYIAMDAQAKLKGRLDQLVIFNPFDLLCDDKVCRQEIDGNPVYRDEHHLSREGSIYLATAMITKFKD